jgi:hypothetical protein
MSDAVPSKQMSMVEPADDHACEKCGSTKFWVDCWNGCDEGWITDLYEQDPLWYDEDDMERCDICRGKAGWYVCSTCHPESFDD